MGEDNKLVLCDYWRSSAAYRVRIVLNLKGLEYEHWPVNLAVGEQARGEFLAINPQGLVPALHHHGRTVTQSLAICAYLDELAPEPPLLPGDAVGRAQVRALALTVACDMHPLNNLRVLKYLKGPLAHDEAEVNEWYEHWIAAGFSAYEQLLGRNHNAGTFSFGDAPTLADACLVPQYYNAERFNCDLAPYPMIKDIVSRCRELPAFANAAPEAQPDAVTG